MADDLGLEALAAIQAEESRYYQEAAGFRAKYLGGSVLTDELAAAEWVRGQLDAPEDTHGFRPVVPETFRDEKTADGVRGERYTWEAEGADETSRTYKAEKIASEAMHALGGLVALLSLRYSWPAGSTLRFVLCDQVPRLKPVGVTTIQRYERGMHGGSGKPDALGFTSYVAGPYSEEIVLRCRPNATIAEVTAAYQEAQRRVLEESYIGPRERTRPITSPDVRDRAMLGVRVLLGQFSDWADAFDTYKAEHPDDARRYQSSKEKGRLVYYENMAPDLGRFRRDVRTAYLKATGADLDWKPSKNGKPASVTRTVSLGGVVDSHTVETHRSGTDEPEGGRTGVQIITDTIAADARRGRNGKP